MATKTVWYFDKEDKKEIESYSKEISKLFKNRGFNLDYGDCFDIEGFKSFLDFVKFISFCDDDTKQKCLNWAF